MLYDAVVPEASDDEEWEVMSPVSRVSFDRVTKLSRVRLARRSEGNGYVVEAAIPLDDLRFEPRDGQRVKMDWGMLVTGPDGFEVLRRVYWANKATGIVSDIPSEAKIEPYLWGYVRFHEQTKQKVQGTLGETENILKDKGDDEMIDEFLEELEDDLK